MQVKRLQINAFRGIEALDLKFRPGANVLIGVNGVGKSSILDFLTLLLIIVNKKTLFSIIDDGVIKLGHSEACGNLAIETSDGQQHPIAVGIHRQSSLDKQPNVNVTSDLNRIPIEAIYYPVQRNIPLGALEEVEATSDSLPSTAIKEAWKGQTLFKLTSQAFNLTYQALYGEANFQDFFYWFKEHEDLENETRLEADPAYRDRQLEAVRQAIPIFLPGFTNLKIKRSPLRMVVTKRNRELIISQLSDGERSLLTIIGDIARRLAIYNHEMEKPLEGEGIILIDEIDAHLHPKWQRGIIPKLERTFPNCQFFIATHSPQIISDVKSENIYLLKQDAAGEVIAVHPEGTYGRDTNQILEDVMGVSDRPEWSKNDLQQLFRLIDSGDLPAARDLKNRLESSIGIDEPEFAKADVLIRRKEILGR